MKKIDIQNAVNAFGRIPVNKVKNEQIRYTLKVASSNENL